MKLSEKIKWVNQNTFSLVQVNKKINFFYSKYRSHRITIVLLLCVCMSASIKILEERCCFFIKVGYIPETNVLIYIMVTVTVPFQCCVVYSIIINRGHMHAKWIHVFGIYFMLSIFFCWVGLLFIQTFG